MRWEKSDRQNCFEVWGTADRDGQWRPDWWNYAIDFHADAEREVRTMFGDIPTDYGYADYACNRTELGYYYQERHNCGCEVSTGVSGANEQNQEASTQGQQIRDVHSQQP